MVTFEERLTRVERDTAELKKDVEVLNSAFGGFVSKATLEKVNAQNDKIFDTLINHDQFTNQQLAELRNQLVEQDGKIVGLQAEMRQRFEKQDAKIDSLQTRFDGLETRFDGMQTQLTRLEQLLLERLPLIQ